MSIARKISNIAMDSEIGACNNVSLYHRVEISQFCLRRVRTYVCTPRHRRHLLFSNFVTSSPVMQLNLIVATSHVVILPAIASLSSSVLQPFRILCQLCYQALSINFSIFSIEAVNSFKIESVSWKEPYYCSESQLLSSSPTAASAFLWIDLCYLSH